MSNTDKAALVPRLRFRAFQRTALRNVSLGDVTEECRSRNGSKHSVAAVMGVTKANGIVPMEAGLISEDIARYKLVDRNCFAYNPMRINIGSIARWQGEKKILVSPDYVVFKCIQNAELSIIPEYLDQFRHTVAWERFVTEGGDGSVRVRIYYKDIARIGLSLPSLPEQQKIADCLSSLDELIAAQARKLDALKTHKKGLMQQLFPREGETQPRLRFPEFLNSGEWEWVELGEKVDLLSGYPFDGSDISQDSSGIPLLRGINVTEGRIRHNSEIDRYYIGSIQGLEKYRLQVNDLVIGMDGSKVGKNSALVSENDVGALLIQRVARLRAKKVPLIQFIFQRVHSPSFHAYVDRINTSSGIPHISAKQIKEFRICFPSDEEQQRIADCLSSLDTLINTATQELETFKTHKKGLMQQLFPSAEALEA
jgi:type I restriction enzyme S subunit